MGAKSKFLKVKVAIFWDVKDTSLFKLKSVKVGFVGVAVIGIGGGVSYSKEFIRFEGYRCWFTLSNIHRALLSYVLVRTII